MLPLDRLIRVYVAEHDTTMSNVAERLGMTKDTILKRRRGATKLSFAEAAKIAELLEMSLDDLAAAIL